MTDPDGKKTILAIDDSPLDLAVLTEALKDDYRVLAATDPQSALGLIHSEQPPVLILLDILMPGVDGMELCRRIKADEATREIPVIFVTAMGAVENEADGFAAGAVDYIVKPVNPHIVRARVKTHVELTLARGRLKRQNEILRDNARLREEVEQISRHDLKNPLMVILNIPPVLMAHSTITGEEREMLKLLGDAGRRMLEMINRSIDLCRMENGTYALRAAPTDALKVSRQIAAALAEISQRSGVVMELRAGGRIAGSDEAFIVSAEELLLYSMLFNLARNAVEASPAGSTVTLSFAREKAGVIAIHNAGAIPEKIRGRFFEKFATAGKPGGTGLGAYSAQLIARTLGGSIAFETSEISGTTVTVRLPLPAGGLAPA
ncbi:MAG: response regulator [Spirochaetia bacterium]|jgi:signal transduction histidine kinase